MKSKLRLFFSVALLSLLMLNVGMVSNTTETKSNGLSAIFSIQKADAGSEPNYMHMGWCPNKAQTWGTYCNSTYAATACSNPSC